MDELSYKIFKESSEEKMKDMFEEYIILNKMLYYDRKNLEIWGNDIWLQFCKKFKSESFDNFKIIEYEDEWGYTIEFYYKEI